MEFAKADFFAEKLLNIGNNFLKKGEYFLALIAYNKTICYAVSENILATSYVNRSAVYFNVGMYKESLKNIEWAREIYPKEKIEKLNEREEKYKKFMLQNADKPKDIPDKFFQLSYPPNEADSKFAGCLEIRDNKYYAARDLKPGDIIYIGEGSFKLMLQPGYVNQCYSCFKVNSMNLIPSVENAVFMFCSEECRDQPAIVSDAEARANQLLRQKHAYKIVRHRMVFDPCPFYDEYDISSIQSPFADSKEPNTSYFRFDGIKEAYYITKPVKAGELLTTKARTETFSGLLSDYWNVKVDSFACTCFHCKDMLSARDPKFVAADEKPKELLTAIELVEKLTENWNRIGEINNKKQLRKMIEANDEYMKLLAIKKTYLAKGRYCICRTCALKVNGDIFVSITERARAKITPELIADFVNNGGVGKLIPL